MWRGLTREEAALRGIWLALAFFALQATSEALTYILGNPAFFDPPFKEKYIRHLVLVRCHGVSAAVALVAGVLQFAPESLRFRFHRYLGRLYFWAVVVASLTSLPMALIAEGGAITRLSFFLLGAAWLGTACLALAAVKRRDLAAHRRWMVRNYALTYGAVLLRLFLHFMLESGFKFEEVYPTSTWTWVIGLAVAEWWIGYSERGKE